jgi:hypothetical protein
MTNSNVVDLEGKPAAIPPPITFLCIGFEPGEIAAEFLHNKSEDSRETPRMQLEELHQELNLYEDFHGCILLPVVTRGGFQLIIQKVVGYE